MLCELRHAINVKECGPRHFLASIDLENKQKDIRNNKRDRKTARVLEPSRLLTLTHNTADLTNVPAQAGNGNWPQIDSTITHV